jgi:hypothetical protein
MTYAQKNYLEWLGTGNKYRIDQAGCFLVANTNLVNDEFGIQTNPLALNKDFINKGIYIDAAPKDGALDDLSWDSIIREYPQLYIVPNAPLTSRSIIKQQLRPGVLHFSKVQRVEGGNVFIVDSYDGQVKNASVYGAILDHRTYASNMPEPAVHATPYIPPAPALNHAGKTLFLPSSTGTWRVYNLAGPWTIGHEVGTLATGSNPPGLNYDILTTIAPNIYKIHTETWGDVAIYAGPDTIAQFKDQAPAPVATPVEAPLPQLTNNVPPPSPTPTIEEPKGETIPVSVIPDGFKQTFTEENKGKYRAVRDAVIKDLNNEEDKRLPDAQLIGGQVYDIAEWFDKAGVHYGRTAKSVSARSWHGIHEDLLEPEEDAELLNLETANEHRIELGNLTVVERTKGLFKPLKNLILRLIGKYEAKQNNKKGE